MIGDVPYGTAAEEHFPTFVRGINADPDVTMVTHLGDIKSGSTPRPLASGSSWLDFYGVQHSADNLLTFEKVPGA